MIEQLLLARHGETPGNRNRVVQTPETPLSETGRLQAGRLARRVAELLGGRRLLVVSSDYRRARETAEIVAAGAGAEGSEAERAQVELEPLLRERNFGQLRGQSYDDIARRQIDPFAVDYRPPGGDDWPTFDDRGGAAWRALLHRVDAERADERPALLLAVTHGFVLRRLIGLHLRRDRGGAPIEVPERWGNTSLTLVDGGAPHPVLLLNCVAHLDSAVPVHPRAISGI